MKIVQIFILVLLVSCGNASNTSSRIPLTVKNFQPGAPVTMGVPFPKGALQSPDQVRLLNRSGKELPAQVTEVATWDPIDPSIKWIWVFFFAEDEPEYYLEYGPGVTRQALSGDIVKVDNNQRPRQDAEVETGPLKFTIRKGQGGFLDEVYLDLERDGFEADDLIASSDGARGSFMDMLDDAGIDPSKAVITRTIKVKGSGPLHAILRCEGMYYYERDDNEPSPFELYIHAFAGKSYIKVYHTLTYTGKPDKSKTRPGEHLAVATQLADDVIQPERTSSDPGWTQPNDRIAATGLALQYKLSGATKVKSGYKTDKWWENTQRADWSHTLGSKDPLSLLQTGPKPDRVPPVPVSSGDQRLEGFSGTVQEGDQVLQQAERLEGWVDISDDNWGVSLGIKNFLEEYPKEIRIDPAQNKLTGFAWSPLADPMSFARWSNESDQGMVENFAAGLTKTSELVFHFHPSGLTDQDIQQAVNYVLQPSMGHAEANWYSQSGVYGNFAPKSNAHADYERGLDYRMGWSVFSQHWDPWYGMFDYGDHKNAYYNDQWMRWMNNEPAVDFMFWLQFMRSGDPAWYQTAIAASMHTMDVDNIHWPTDPKYIGDTNESLDFFKHQATPSRATPYLGIGRRHANQHWNAVLSAHVWVPGWIASYYLHGYHRGLEVAKLTAETYLKRIWGDHDLRGRRLYLSVWNLGEIYDATKDPRYLEELQYRVNQMLDLQRGPDQYGSLVIDRYGYSQGYASHGLYKYFSMTGDVSVKNALIRHARALRDNPPWNHQYESYLSTIHSLVLGYEFTGEPSFLQEAVKRASVLKTNELPKPLQSYDSRKELATALEAASNLPKEEGRSVTIWGITQGMRVFGWTHIYNVPWLLEQLEAHPEFDK
ncbi:MAG: hypothetical protein NWR67_03060 [Saprospiraceae bacterium]|nr:hypothetical protein [Saprospiraceae bacterium]MDP4998510.1 hypothetical protein [Saprospiraceae bacterium]